MKTLTEHYVREMVQSTIEDVIADFKRDEDADRETVIKRLDEECDTLFGQLVQRGRVDQYDVEDLIATVQPCAAILRVAREDAWVEDDSGLWDGLTYGVVASIAYFSLRNLLYEGLKRAGYDSNKNYPFFVEGDEIEGEEADA